MARVLRKFDGWRIVVTDSGLLAVESSGLDAMGVSRWVPVDHTVLWPERVKRAIVAALEPPQVSDSDQKEAAAKKAFDLAAEQFCQYPRPENLETLMKAWRAYDDERIPF